MSTRTDTSKDRPVEPLDAPGTILLNGKPRPWREGLVLADLLRELDVDPDPESGSRGIAVALDGRVVSRRAWATTTLADGSRVEVIGAIGGG